MYEKQLIRGVLINIAGVLAKLLHPLFFLGATWLLGTDIVGLYFLAYFIAEFAASAVSSGYGDATTIFASPLADEEKDQGALYQVLANGFVVTMVLSFVLVAATYAGADALVARLYADRPELVPALHLLAWTLPLTGLSRVAICATKALMRMEYETAFEGFFRPFLLVIGTGVVWWLEAGFFGMLWVQLISSILIAALSLWGFARHFSLRKTAASALSLRIDVDMLRFALPQNLNMTLNRYLSRVDVVMLGAYGLSNQTLAFYSAASLITGNLREIRLIFSGALLPVLTRYHIRGERDAFIRELSRAARWITTLVAPFVLILLILRNDILLFIDKSFTGDTVFVAVLLIAPYVNCAFGLGGNAIVFTKHSGWNLINSVLIAGLNTGLNMALIPSLGLLGAAIGAALAQVIICALGLIELYALEKVTIALGAVYKAHAALAIVVVACAVVWDPAELGTVGTRATLAVAAVLTYAAILLALRHEEMVALAAGLRRRMSARRNAS